ncbi:hypothetical protein ACGFZS_39085 [Streptomyces sp. NPDC048288]|uniref:hypothetical protein n=1 Tax=Streptomyces sp. NPDC048288 TaxID=3365529 RepID=UPI0037232949
MKERKSRVKESEKRVGGSGFGIPPKASPDVIAARNAPADKVCRELERGGLPVHRGDAEGDSSPGTSGTRVHVDPSTDGGVLVAWRTGEDLRAAAVDLLEKGGFSNIPPVLRHHETVVQRMADALAGILASAGFEAAGADPYTHGRAVLVKGVHT